MRRPGTTSAALATSAPGTNQSCPSLRLPPATRQAPVSSLKLPYRGPSHVIHLLRMTFAKNPIICRTKA